MSKLTSQSSQNDVETVAEVASEYLLEMVNTAQVWQLYYRVYRPFRRPWRPEQQLPRQRNNNRCRTRPKARIGISVSRPWVEVQMETATPSGSSTQTSVAPLPTRSHRAGPQRSTGARSPLQSTELRRRVSMDAVPCSSAFPTADALLHDGEALSSKSEDTSALLALPPRSVQPCHFQISCTAHSRTLAWTLESLSISRPSQRHRPTLLIRAMLSHHSRIEIYSAIRHSLGFPMYTKRNFDQHYMYAILDQDSAWLYGVVG